MSDSRFLEVFSGEIAPHLFAHDFFGRRLPELLDFFAGRERFGAVGRLGCAAPFDSSTWKPLEAEAVAWVKTLHPKYDQFTAVEQVRRRYAVSLAALRYTIPRLIADDTFQKTVASLRAEGWKDWHLLMAILNAVANYRVHQRLDVRDSMELFADAMKEEIYSPEKPESLPVPPTHFTRELLRIQLLMAINSGLSSEGLKFHHRTPNVDNIFTYARHRWHYFEIDVEHPDVFALP